MKCPVCGNTTLAPLKLESDLTGEHCWKCGGLWLSAAHYWGWIHIHDTDLPESKGSGLPIPDTDSKNAKLCPECGRLMTMYRIRPDLDFRLDHCGGCGGVWFDHKEWDALKERNLHDNLHEFFTNEYQKKLRRERARQKMEVFYREKFGDETYDAVKRFRDWIESHPMEKELWAYLNDEDPYATS